MRSIRISRELKQRKETSKKLRTLNCTKRFSKLAVDAIKFSIFLFFHSFLLYYPYLGWNYISMNRYVERKRISSESAWKQPMTRENPPNIICWRKNDWIGRAGNTPWRNRNKIILLVPGFHVQTCACRTVRALVPLNVPALLTISIQSSASYPAL